MRRSLLRGALFAAMLAVALATRASAGATGAPADAPEDVLKATLANGLRVVIVPNALAPVVATDVLYVVGSRDDPAEFPGMAHAQEHMMFRGTPNLSTAQLGTLATALGGDFDASTAATTTEFQFTVPAADLDAILRVESDRMREVLDAQSEWEAERGAIEQEVLRDQSDPSNAFFSQAQEIAFAGTPYAHDGVGTVAAFNRLTGPEIKAFHERWYAPNNAVLVIAGDVEPQAALAQVRSYFDPIPRRAVPAQPAIHLRPLHRVVLRQETSLIYPLAALAYRFPGIADPDFLACFVLQSVLDARRGPLHRLADAGLALDAEWNAEPYVPEAQLGVAVVALPPGGDPAAMVGRVERIIADVRQNGVSPELFASTKRQLIASQEFSRNSLTSLASDWATTIGLDNEPSIAREQELIAQVTLAQVNRAARTYLDPQRAIVGELTPSANAGSRAAPIPPAPGPEKQLAVTSAEVALPAWAERYVEHLSVPPSYLHPSEMGLPNGLRLIVQPETISNAVFVYGAVKNEPALQEPAGQAGVAEVFDAIFAEGTGQLARVQFETAQDDLDSAISGGTGFGMQTTPAAFDRAIALLAQNELSPRLTQSAFENARQLVLQNLATTLTSVGSIGTLRANAQLFPPESPELRQPSPDAIRALTLADVKAYASKVMRPDLTTIVVIGNVSPAAARVAIGRAFGGWQAHGPPPDLVIPPVPANAGATLRLPLPETEQSYVMLQEIVPLARSAPALVPLRVGDAILGGGSGGPEQSRLFRDLRQNAGLVYSIGSDLEINDSYALFGIDYACLPANQPKISALVESEVRTLGQTPVGAFELALAKAALVRRGIVADGSVGTIGQTLLADAVNGVPLDRAERDAHAVVATDAEAIRAAFAQYVDPARFVQTIEGP
ncbi:MAG: M16 family metallopeptidase [Vulcanimicrobiaceae bacterium]